MSKLFYFTSAIWAIVGIIENVSTKAYVYQPFFMSAIFTIAAAIVDTLEELKK